MLAFQLPPSVTSSDRPKAIDPDGARRGYWLRPCLAQWPPAERSGDLFEFFVGPSGMGTFFLADVSGNGSAVAPVASRVRRLAQAFLAAELPLRALLGAINDALEMDEVPGCFVCAVAARFDPRARRLRVARAGHLGAFVRRTNGQTRCIEAPVGLALGILPDQDYAEEEVELEATDTVVLATDGITDRFATAADPTGKTQFARWLGVLPASPRAICQSLLPRGRADRGDATVLAIALAKARHHQTLDRNRSRPWSHKQEKFATS